MTNGHLGCLIKTFVATFDLQVAPILLPNTVLIGLSVQEKKFKIDFQDGVILDLNYYSRF